MLTKIHIKGYNINKRIALIENGLRRRKLYALNE